MLVFKEETKVGVPQRSGGGGGGGGRQKAVATHQQTLT